MCLRRSGKSGWKTSRMTPLPKRGFGPPSYGTFCAPLRCQFSVFPVQKSTTEQSRRSFGWVQKFPGERVLWYVFLPPYVWHPPYHGPTSTPLPKNPEPPPPTRRYFMGIGGFSSRKNQKIPGAHKIGEPFPAPELQAEKLRTSRFV